MKTKLSTLFFLFFVLCCFPIVYSQTLLYGLTGSLNGAYYQLVSYWDNMHYGGDGILYYAIPTMEGGYLYMRFFGFNLLSGSIMLNCAWGDGWTSYNARKIAVVGSTLYFSYAVYSGGVFTSSYVGKADISGSTLTNFQTVSVGSGDCVLDVFPRSSGGVWIVKTNGYGYYTPNTYISLGSTVMAKAIHVHNARDISLTINSNILYLFINGTFYQVDRTLVPVYPYDAYNPAGRSNTFYAVKIGNYIYVGWAKNQYYGIDKIDINLKKIVGQTSIWFGFPFSVTAPICIGFDSDTLMFIYFKDGNFYFININGDSGKATVGYDSTKQVAWYIHNIIFQVEGLDSGERDIYIYKTNALGNPPVWNVNYYLDLTVQYQSYPPKTGETITFTGKLYLGNTLISRSGALIGVNDSYVDNVATTSGEWRWNYTIPPFYGYGSTVDLEFKFIVYDFEAFYGRRALEKTLNIQIKNNVSAIPPTWVISPLYVFEVNLLTPTVGWVTNFTYVFHIKFAQVYNTSLIPTNGTVLTFINNAIVRQIDFKDIMETQTSIMFNRSGYYTLQFNAYNSSQALVGRKVWYINISGQPTLPPPPPKPIPSIIDVIGATTFSNLLIILLLLLTPIFIFARIGFAGILVGGIIGLILCYIAGLIQLWMIVLAGIGILAIIFFGYKGG